MAARDANLANRLSQASRRQVEEPKIEPQSRHSNSNKPSAGARGVEVGWARRASVLIDIIPTTDVN